MAEDVIKGNNADLTTLNQYIYCRNKPIDLVDKNGKEPDNPVEILIPENWSLNDEDDENPFPELPFTYIPDSEIPNNIIEIPLLPSDSMDKEKTEISYPTVSINPDSKEIKVFNISVEGGTGLYADFDIDGVGAQLGGKIFMSYSNQGKYFFTEGMKLSGGVDVGGAGAEAGYQYVWYPMLDAVDEEGWYMESSVLGVREEDGDYILGIGASLYAAIGFGVQIDVNFSEMGRRFKKMINILFNESKESSKE